MRAESIRSEIAGSGHESKFVCEETGMIGWHAIEERVVRRCVLLLVLIVGVVAPMHAQSEAEFDSYKLKLSGFWFYSNPSGTVQGSNETDTINLQKDFGFDSYSTFSGKLDWKFTHKNHFYVIGSSFNQTRQATLVRTINFQGQTYVAGLSTKANLSAPLIAPGYQYDFIRRKRGYLGAAVQIDLFNASASLSSMAQVINGTQQVARSSSASLLAPIPVAGPVARLYLTNSPRLYVDANIFGMYLFGYGNFISTADYLGVTIAKHFSVNAGYQLGSRLVVNNDSKTDRIGIRLTQSGPIAGLQAWF